MSVQDIFNAPAKPGVPLTAKRTILVIEDDVIAMELMILVLNALAYDVIPAVNGQAGLEIARASKPCLVICDLQMPELDGYGVLAALKSDPVTRSIPLVAITGTAMIGDEALLLARGVNGFVNKPFEFLTLQEELARLLPAIAP